MANTLETRLYDTIVGRCNINTIKQLVEDGVDCNVSRFDCDTQTFVSFIQLAAEKVQYRALRLLFEKRNSPTKTQLEKYLTFYINHHKPSQEEENETLLEYTVSRLLHINITQHSTISFSILIAALYDFDDVKLRGEELSVGSTQDMFLQLRIFTLFRRIIRMHTDFPMILDNEELIVIQNELLHDLETHYFLYDVAAIPVHMTKNLLKQKFAEVKLAQKSLMEFYRCIATNVINKIRQLQPDQEYTIPTGWRGHAVCVSFQRINETHINIRVDNPSSENPTNAHRVENSAGNYRLIEPRILGRLHLNHLEANMDYFISLIDSVKRDLSASEGASLIYNVNRQIQHLNARHVESIPCFVEQADSNCFIRCFEPGFRIRLGHTRKALCEKLIAFEIDNANLLSRRRDENLRGNVIEFSNRFAALARENDENKLPVSEETRLREQLKMSYQQNYRYLSNIMTMESCNPLKDKYIPLRFETEHTSIELQNIFNEPRVLVLGEAGCGKTTVCQHATYSWAWGKIWQNKFDWLFYIKMRNLTSRLYPPQSHSYTLIDVIEKECYQGYTLLDLDKIKLKSQLANPSNILWIIDGLDERTIPDHLHSIEQELLAKPNLLLTARTYVEHDFRFNVQTKIQGFTEDDVKEYINKYYSIMFRTTADECWSFIQSSKQLLKIARTPACLEIICSLWENGKKELKLEMTMGQLYEKMCEYLLRRYLLKFHRQYTSGLDGRNLYLQYNAEPFRYLERLAFEATRSSRFLIRGDELADIAGPSVISVLQVGLLKSKSRKPSLILTENIYYFIHRKFQEYLCARYMIKSLSSACRNDHEKEVIKFIAYEKYNRRLRETFHFFFELKRSDFCTDQFWSAVDSEPRDLIGLRHCSRIMQWFPNGSCEFSPKDEQEINKRTSDVILSWITKKDRRAHDYGNMYLFEWFFDVIPEQNWLKAWKEDLFMEDPSQRRYFLPDLWSTENISALKEIYINSIGEIDINISQNVGPLHRLIFTGPTTHSLKFLNQESNSFIVYNETEVSEVIAALEEAKRHESITTPAEFQAVLQTYTTFANLNRRAVALGKVPCRWNIAPSALENITNETLNLVLGLSQQNTLFFRYVEFPVISFLELYANRNDLNDDILCSLIVSITMSNSCLLTAPPGQKKLIRVPENETYVQIELDERRWFALIYAFGSARDTYGYSSFFEVVSI